jgi:hypothetical protein
LDNEFYYFCTPFIAQVAVPIAIGMLDAKTKVVFEDETTCKKDLAQVAE